MPCTIYRDRQKRLCYLTDEWNDWEFVKKKELDPVKHMRRMKGRKRK